MSWRGRRPRELEALDSDESCGVSWLDMLEPGRMGTLLNRAGEKSLSTGGKKTNQHKLTHGTQKDSKGSRGNDGWFLADISVRSAILVGHVSMLKILGDLPLGSHFVITPGQLFWGNYIKHSIVEQTLKVHHMNIRIN